MALVEEQGGTPDQGGFTRSSKALADGWRRLGRIATIVALMGAPSVFLWAYVAQEWSAFWSVLFTIGCVAVARGVIDVILRKLVPWPTLYGDDSARRRETDALDRKRAWFWSRRVRLAIWIAGIVTVVFAVRAATASAGETITWFGTFGWLLDQASGIFSNPAILFQVVFVFFLFIANFAILFGPLLAMGITQIKGFEPGDADWGVRLEDVRGQAEPKEEVRRVVSLWQSGEAFERAGGKRERGLLFLGAPGTGKTMLAKAIATGFNSPFVSIPGSGFASTFIGIDAVLVRF
ncbi:MAG: AAA family ATPase, partial [Actinomycetota bacterium]